MDLSNSLKAELEFKELKVELELEIVSSKLKHICPRKSQVGQELSNCSWGALINNLHEEAEIVFVFLTLTCRFFSLLLVTFWNKHQPFSLSLFPFFLSFFYFCSHKWCFLPPEKVRKIQSSRELLSKIKVITRKNKDVIQEAK